MEPVIATAASYLRERGVTDLASLTAFICDDPDRQANFFAYELAGALELGLLPWELVPVGELERVGAYRYRRRFADYGVDLAAADLSTAAQVKWYAPGHPVSFRAMSTFHTYSTTTLDAGRRILLTSPNVKASRPGDRIPHEHVELSPERAVELLAPTLGYVPAPPPPPEVLELRDYQAAAITAALEAGSGRIAMACGSGKSAVMSRVAEAWWGANPDGVVAILVPSLLLLDQMADSLARWAPAVPVQTLGGGSAPTPGFAGVVVSTYQSVRHLGDVGVTQVIVDEAHHTESEGAEGGWLAAVDELAEACADVLSFSATFGDDEVEPIFEYTLEAAIAEGHLTDYEVVIPVHGEGETAPALARMVAARPTWTKVLAYCNSRDAGRAFADLCQAAGVPAEYFDGETPVAERQAAIDRLRGGEVRVLVTVYVLGEGVDIPEADTCLFVEPRGSRVNVVQCLGRVLRLHPAKALARVVLPAADDEAELRRFLRLISAADPRVGRAVREGRARGRVEFVDVEEIAGGGDAAAEIHYEGRYDRLGAELQDSFEWKLEVLRTYVEEHGELPQRKRGKKASGFDLGMWCTVCRHNFKKGRLSERQICQLEEVPGWVWDSIAEKFCIGMEHLCAYVKKYGELPKKSTVVDGYALGSWCNTQRQTYKKGKQTDNRVHQFEKIPGWVWDVTEEKFQKGIAVLKRYVQDFHSIPESRKKYQGFNLGVWCDSRRQDHKNGKLTQEQIETLEDIPGWVWSLQQNRFRVGIEVLREYVQKYGRLTTRLEKVEGFNISSWCTSRRGDYKKGKLSEGQIETLESLPGWHWDAVKGRFLEALSLLKTYVDTHKSLPRHSTKVAGFNLGSWCATRRQAYKKGKAPEYQIAQLEMVPGWYWTKN